jgi:hypothetical protein
MTQFTEKEFLEQLSLFREEIGKKSFWRLSEKQRDNFQHGIKFAFLNIVRDDGKPATSEDYEKWGNWITNALNEYSRREFMIYSLAFAK